LQFTFFFFVNLKFNLSQLKIKSSDLDSQLLIQLKKGDHDSFRKLFEKYSNPLFRFANSYLKSNEAAEDVVQFVFTKVWDNRNKLKTDTSFQSYLFTIALNSIRQNFNKLSKQNELKHNILIGFAATQTDFDENNEYQALLDKLDELIARMPEKRKEVFIKKKIEEKSSKEIAEECTISLKTVEYHIHEAMKFLKKEFDKIQTIGIFFFHLFF